MNRGNYSTKVSFHAIQKQCQLFVELVPTTIRNDSSAVVFVSARDNEFV